MAIYLRKGNEELRYLSGFSREEIDDARVIAESYGFESEDKICYCLGDRSITFSVVQVALKNMDSHDITDLIIALGAEYKADDLKGGVFYPVVFSGKRNVLDAFVLSETEQLKPVK